MRASSGKEAGLTGSAVATDAAAERPEANGVKSRKLGEVVARKIEAKIMKSRWPVGEVIGSESDLLAEHQVSRAVMREAIRLLEHHGTATMRRGPGGGLVVTKPDAQAVIRSASVYLDSAGITSDKLSSARTAIELIAVQLAAESIDEQGIARLRSAIDKERQNIRSHQRAGASEDVHTVIAQLSGNPAIQLFTETLTQLELEFFRAEVAPESLEQTRAELLSDHQEIVEAIVNGDAGIARYRMQQHLARVASELRPH